MQFLHHLFMIDAFSINRGITPGLYPNHLKILLRFKDTLFYSNDVNHDVSHSDIYLVNDTYPIMYVIMDALLHQLI